jgi:hypothetical protein
VPNPATENLGKLAKLLGDLDASILDTSDFETAELPVDPTSRAGLELGGNFCLLTDLGRLDVMQWISGVETDDLYAKLHPNAVEGILEGMPFRVCGLEHLLVMKRAAGRPRDLEDIERLG